MWNVIFFMEVRLTIIRGIAFTKQLNRNILHESENQQTCTSHSPPSPPAVGKLLSAILTRFFADSLEVAGYDSSGAWSSKPKISSVEKSSIAPTPRKGSPVDGEGGGG